MKTNISMWKRTAGKIALQKIVQILDVIRKESGHYLADAVTLCIPLQFATKIDRPDAFWMQQRRVTTVMPK